MNWFRGTFIDVAIKKKGSVMSRKFGKHSLKAKKDIFVAVLFFIGLES